VNGFVGRVAGLKEEEGDEEEYDFGPQGG